MFQHLCHLQTSGCWKKQVIYNVAVTGPDNNTNGLFITILLQHSYQPVADYSPYNHYIPIMIPWFHWLCTTNFTNQTYSRCVSSISNTTCFYKSLKPTPRAHVRAGPSRPKPRETPRQRASMPRQHPPRQISLEANWSGATIIFNVYLWSVVSSLNFVLHMDYLTLFIRIADHVIMSLNKLISKTQIHITYQLVHCTAGDTYL